MGSCAPCNTHRSDLVDAGCVEANIKQRSARLLGEVRLLRREVHRSPLVRILVEKGRRVNLRVGMENLTQRQAHRRVPRVSRKEMGRQVGFRRLQFEKRLKYSRA